MGINDINVYNNRMDKSLEDKLWFINDTIDYTDIYVDFGCANGNLIKHLAKEYPNKRFIGYDNNNDMIELAKSNCKSLNNVAFTDNFNSILILIKAFKKNRSCLILSSVLHEVYSYSSKEKIDEFWEMINDANFNFIAIRDMNYGYVNESKLSESIELFSKNIYKYGDKKQISDFENVYGKIDNIKKITSFLLKYKYVENWDRELIENYFDYSINLDFSKYAVLHFKYYVLEYLKDLFKKDFDIDFSQFFTHKKMLITLK